MRGGSSISSGDLVKSLVICECSFLVRSVFCSFFFFGGGLGGEGIEGCFLLILFHLRWFVQCVFLHFLLCLVKATFRYSYSNFDCNDKFARETVCALKLYFRMRIFCLQVPSYVMLGIPKHEDAPPTPQHPLSPMGDACSRMDLTAIHQILVMTHYKDDEGTNEVTELYPCKLAYVCVCIYIYLILY